MADTIKIPGVGVQPKKTVYIAVGGVAILAGIAYYRRKKAAAAAPVATASQTDPATGFPYGSAEDAAALGQQAAYIAPTPLNFSGGSAITPGGVNISQTFSDNASWERAAIDYLTNTVGLTVGAVSSALSKYIGGQPVTPTEQGIIQQAIAAEGQAPVAGANGYPPSIRQATASTGGIPNIADGYYRANPSGTHYEVKGNRRWRLSAATVAKLGQTSYHPITDTSINKLPLVGVK